MRKNITLRNDFHKTEITLRANVVGSSTLSISHSQAKKAQKKLCGIKGCQCSDDMGVRGCDQDFHYSSGFHGGYYLIMNDNKNY
jgi:hypothetical protein